MVPESFIRANRYKFFTVGAIGTFMATLDGSILNVALPTISGALNASIDMVAWVVLSYSLTLISLMLVFGVWAGEKGYNFAYRFGYIFFIIGSLSCALSQNIYMLIISRVIQATGTAMFAAIGPGMVTTVFPDKERGKGIGMMVMMVAAGFMVGPPLGGLMLGLWPWQSIFIINIPIGFVGLWMTAHYFRHIPKPGDHRRLNFKSAVAISLSLLSLTFAISFLNDYKLTDIRLIGLSTLSLACFLAFLKYEASEETALIGLNIFKNNQFTASIAAMLFMFMGTSGVFILIPFYLEHIRHFEPKQVGMFLIILPVLMFVFAPLAGRFSDKIGYRVLTVSGVLILLTGLFLLKGIEVETTNGYIVLCLVVIGCGIGLFSTPNSSALMGSVSEKQRAVTSGILATTRNIGMSVGVALATALFTYFQAKNSFLKNENLIFIKSYHTVIWVAMAITFLSLIFSFIRGERQDRKAHKIVDKAEIKDII